VVVEHSERTVPVYAGCPGPLLVELHTALYLHGSEGLGDIGSPKARLQPEREHTVDYLMHVLTESDEPIDVTSLAPLTNLAMALRREPAIEELVGSLIMMSSGLAGENATATAEFNVWVDPDAADVVFRSRIPQTLVAPDPIIQYAQIPRVSWSRSS
jgi:pyrimidine-specific ribonucleoside hydrolase